LRAIVLLYSKFMLAEYNEWSKNVDERPHWRLVTPLSDEWIRPTLTPSKKWFLEPT